MNDLNDVLENMFAHSEPLRNSMAVIVTADINDQGQERIAINVADGGLDVDISEEHANAIRVLIAGLVSGLTKHTGELQQWAIEDLIEADIGDEAGVDYGNA